MRGPKARTTKQKSRIQAAGHLKQELQAVKGRNIANKKIEVDFESSNRKTKKAD